MRIVLIGYRGSGKTSVGNALAERRGIEFVDTDQVIALRLGMTISQIFESMGQDKFRDTEAAVLQDAIRWIGPRVISTGGGVVLRLENRQLLAASGAYRVYLKCEEQELLRRIRSDPESISTRPALSQLGADQEIRKLLAERGPLYDAVKTNEIDVTKMSVESVVEQLDALLPPITPADWME